MFLSATATTTSPPILTYSLTTGSPSSAESERSTSFLTSSIVTTVDGKLTTASLPRPIQTPSPSLLSALTLSSLPPSRSLLQYPLLTVNPNRPLRINVLPS